MTSFTLEGRQLSLLQINGISIEVSGNPNDSAEAQICEEQEAVSWTSHQGEGVGEDQCNILDFSD